MSFEAQDIQRAKTAIRTAVPRFVFMIILLERKAKAEGADQPREILIGPSWHEIMP
jgi:hypothetical protein